MSMIFKEKILRNKEQRLKKLLMNIFNRNLSKRKLKKEEEILKIFKLRINEEIKRKNYKIVKR